MGVAEVVGGQLNGNVNAGQLQLAMSPHHSQAPFNKLGHNQSAGGTCHGGKERGHRGSCINESHNEANRVTRAPPKGIRVNIFRVFVYTKLFCFC